jgi:hypothetical protein
MTQYCDFSDLPVASCAHCKAGGRVLPAEIEMTEAGPARGPWITAQYSGRCVLNRGHQIKPGDQIRSDGEGAWLCASCG